MLLRLPRSPRLCGVDGRETSDNTKLFCVCNCLGGEDCCNFSGEKYLSCGTERWSSLSWRRRSNPLLPSGVFRSFVRDSSDALVGRPMGDSAGRRRMCSADCIAAASGCPSAAELLVPLAESSREAWDFDLMTRTVGDKLLREGDASAHKKGKDKK